MKRTILTVCAASLLLFACKNEKTADDAKKETTSEKMDDSKDAKKTPKEKPDSATMMKNWQEYMTPSDVHKMMAKWDGTWTGNVSHWMEPGAPEQKSTTKSVNKMIMNGLYQESRHSGDMMGMPFEGISTTAYDNVTKEFISSWIDNMGSGMMVLRGKWDDATKTITFKGTATDPGTKEECDVKETFTIIDDNTQEMKMYIVEDGKDFQTMNIKFTRK